MKKIRLRLNVIAALMAMLPIYSCTEDSPTTDPRQPEPPVAETGTFAKGADVSWLTEMESKGVTFKGADGTAKECMSLLKSECGVNAIRLRVWVNPVDGWNNIDDVVVKARRAQALGLRLMIDFHFSDTWADPGAQTIPAAWADYDLTQMKQAVADHVSQTLTRLKTYGIEPEWVQIGNESTTGMLWPMGELSNGDNYAQLNNAGYDAVKAVCPDCSVIVHLHSGDNLWLYTNMFDYLKANGGKYDIIGMSLYPEDDTWQSLTDSCLSNIRTLISRYGKHVMICEIGMSWDSANAAAMMQKMVDGCKGIEGCDGIFYWEPECYAGWNGYTKGAFDENGKPTSALNAFLAE